MPREYPDGLFPLALQLAASAVAGTARQKMFAPKTDAAAGLLRIGITCSCTLLQNCHRATASGPDAAKVHRGDPVNQPDPRHRHQQTNHAWVEDADRRWWWEGRRHPPQQRPPVWCCSKGSYTVVWDPSTNVTWMSLDACLKGSVPHQVMIPPQAPPAAKGGPSRPGDASTPAAWD